MKKRIIRHGNVWAENKLPKEAYECPECRATNARVSGAFELNDIDFINLKCDCCKCVYEVKV